MRTLSPVYSSIHPILLQRIPSTKLEKNLVFKILIFNLILNILNEVYTRIAIKPKGV
jgi:hypothetical protein